MKSNWSDRTKKMQKNQSVYYYGGLNSLRIAQERRASKWGEQEELYEVMKTLGSVFENY